MDSDIRTKTNGSTKIIYDERKGVYVVSKTTKKEFFDPILRTWGNPQYKHEILPLSSLGKNEPKKVIETTILLLKPLLNSVEEKLIPFKEKICIEVVPNAKNIFITEASMGFFQNDLNSGQCAPMTFRCSNVIITRGKREQISNEEFNALKSKYKVYHESPKGELSIQVQVPN